MMSSNMPEWSNEFTLAFLESYREEPVIWDPSHAKHKDHLKVKEAWIRLSHAMQRPVQELKRKKDSLMATYRCLIRKRNASIRSGAEGDDVYKPVWFAYGLMEQFLAPLYEYNGIVASSDVDSSNFFHLKDESSNPDEQADDSDNSNNIAIVNNIQEETMAVLPSPASSQFTRKRKYNSELSRAEKQMQEAFKTLKEIVAKQGQDEEEDECGLFAKLLAKRLRKLPDLDRELLMQDINSMVFNTIITSSSKTQPETDHGTIIKEENADPL